MKKSMKMAATLAAISIMTIGTTAAVMAASKEGWNGNDYDGWYYIHDGSKVKGWQQINGVWYYFFRDGEMAQDELVTISGKTYYLSQSGSMGTGWQKFAYDTTMYEQLEDSGLIPERADIEETAIDGSGTQYEDFVWLFFNTNGTAKSDQWFQDVTGLWYYFEDMVMMMGDYAYEVDGDYYGLDENGAMMVGWINNEDTYNKNTPYQTDDDQWYYYASNGKRVMDDTWKKINNVWYYFSDGVAETSKFFYIDNDWFYVNEKGGLETGITKVKEDTKVSGPGFSSKAEVSDDIIVNIGTNGALKTGLNGKENYFALNVGENVNTKLYNNYSIVSGSTFKAELPGQLVKSAFIEDGGNIYFADKYGDLVVKDVIKVEIGGQNYYIGFDKNGKAIQGETAGHKVTIGSRSYKTSSMTYDFTFGTKVITVNLFER